MKAPTLARGKGVINAVLARIVKPALTTGNVMLERHELEAFLTLIEELHFGRTAGRLHVSTARVSQIIARLERVPPPPDGRSNPAPPPPPSTRCSPSSAPATASSRRCAGHALLHAPRRRLHPHQRRPTAALGTALEDRRVQAFAQAAHDLLSVSQETPH
jgi:hypothetical protein